MNKKLKEYLYKKEKLENVLDNLLNSFLDEVYNMEESDKKECISYAYYYDLCNSNTLRQRMGIKSNLNKYCDDIIVKHTCNSCNQLKDFAITCKQDIKTFGRYEVCNDCREESERKRKERYLKSKEEKEIARKENQQRLNKLKYMPYKDYLKSEHWIEFRKKALKHYHYRCGVCGKQENLSVHHRTYKNKGEERLGEVMVLCQECHSKFHDKVQDGN